MLADGIEMATLKTKPTSRDYELLGVTQYVSEEALKKAYRYRVKMWHPDKFQQKEMWEKGNAEERFKEINAAYHRILLDLKKQKLEQQGEGKQGESSKTTRNESGQTARKKDKKFRKKQDSGSEKPRNGWRIWYKWYSFHQTVWKFFSGSYEKWAKVVNVVSEYKKPLVWCLLLGIFVYVNHDLFSTGFLSRGDVQKPAQEKMKPLSDESAAHMVDEEALLETGDEELEELYTSFLDGEAINGDRENKNYFSLGSTMEDVLRVQGPPSHIKGRGWSYGLSEVFFKDGKVVKYNNFDGQLKVQLSPHLEKAVTEESFFTLGSTKEEVLMIQGTPTRVVGHSWSYGFSEIRFREGVVESYDNFFGDLRVRLYPSEPLPEGEKPVVFSLNSTKDEVLAVQGTPSSVRGNFWYYGLSSIQFKEGRVRSVFDHTGDLRFVPSLDR